MKISHEVPLCMLEESRNFNDGDYCLVHLLDKHLQYRKFFVDSVNMGRTVLLDNSLYELGQQFDIDVFANWIRVLQPTEYIIPDKFDDMHATLNAVDVWKRKYDNLPGKKIGVVQGDSEEELIRCYMELEPLVDKIAFTFMNRPYQQMIHHPNKWVRFMLGRIQYLSTLLKLGIINKDKPHHLLGVAHPQEFLFYGKEFDWIESLDTSSPIVLGIDGYTYDSFFMGDWDKPKTKIADIMEKYIFDDQKERIYKNIEQFRKMIRI